MPARIEGVSNAQMLNSVRANARLATGPNTMSARDFQDLVPPASESNLRDVVQTISSYKPAWNTFVEVLLDMWCLSLYQVNSWQNDLAKFKKGRVRNGSWVKEVGFGLVQAHQYNKDATNVFDFDEPEVQSYFHRQSRKVFFDVAINDPALAQAAMDEGELAGYTSGILSATQNSDNIGEYLQMRELFAMYDQYEGAFNYQVPDLAASSDPKADAQKITQMLKETAALMKYPTQNVKFTKSGLPYVVNDLVFVTTPAFLSRNDVYNLASAFNVEYGKFVADMLQEVDEIPIPGAQAIICDRDWFVCVDTLLETAAIQNPKTLANLQVLHHWEVLSYSKLAPFCLFSTRADSAWAFDTPTYTGVTLALPAGVEFAPRAASTDLVAQVQGDHGPNQAVTFKVSGTAGLPVSTNTFIDSGRLWVGSDEQNDQLVVTATSVGDPTKSASLLVGVGAKASTGSTTAANVSGTAETAPGGTCQLTVTTTPEGAACVWQVVGGVSGTFVDGDGLLTLAPDEVPGRKLTVLAIPLDNPAVMGTATVTVAEE